MTNLNIDKPSANDNGRPEANDTPATTVTKPRGTARLRGIGRGVFVAALAVATGTTAFTAARAQGPGPGAAGEGRGFRGGNPGEHMQRRMDHMLEAAGANDTQKAQIKAIWEGLRPQLKEAHQQAHQARQQIGDALAAATINPTQIEQLRKQSVQAMDRVSTLTTQGMVQSAQVLTPEQRRKVLDEVRSHKGRRFGHGRGFGGGFGPGPGAG